MNFSVKIIFYDDLKQLFLKLFVLLGMLREETKISIFSIDGSMAVTDVHI